MIDLTKFYEVIAMKTEEGIEQLKKEKIGTEEYKTLVSQIVSNINLTHDRPLLEKGQPQPQPQEQPQQFDPQSVIGKEFK